MKHFLFSHSKNGPENTKLKNQWKWERQENMPVKYGSRVLGLFLLISPAEEKLLDFLRKPK